MRNNSRYESWKKANTLEWLNKEEMSQSLGIYGIALDLMYIHAYIINVHSNVR